jgi:hypothetical protein
MTLTLELSHLILSESGLAGFGGVGETLASAIRAGQERDKIDRELDPQDRLQGELGATYENHCQHGS